MLTTDPRQTQRNYRNDDGVIKSLRLHVDHARLHAGRCSLWGEPAACTHTHTHKHTVKLAWSIGVFKQLAETTQGLKRDRKSNRSQIPEARQSAAALRACAAVIAITHLL